MVQKPDATRCRPPFNTFDSQFIHSSEVSNKMDSKDSLEKKGWNPNKYGAVFLILSGKAVARPEDRSLSPSMVEVQAAIP